MAESNALKAPRVIAIGASAGGVEAMTYLASNLPRNLNAAVLMVLHIPHNAVSLMPEILRRAGELPAVHAATREPLRAGRIYLAPPDRHMIVRDGTVGTVFGPRENGHRPAVDPLFRSVAEAHGSRAIGVVLTGNLDDGAAGILAIKQAGGVTIAQDPEDALYPGMPTNAIRSSGVDHVLALKEIVPTILRLLEEMPPDKEAQVDNETLDIEIRKVEMDPSVSVEEQVGEPSGFTCPECAGGLWELREGNLFRYRCRVGHAYSAESLISAYGSSVEAALWAALRALEENAEFALRLAKRSEIMDQPNTQGRFSEQAATAIGHAKTIRGILASGPVTAKPAEEVIAPE